MKFVHIVRESKRKQTEADSNHQVDSLVFICAHQGTKQLDLRSFVAVIWIPQMEENSGCLNISSCSAREMDIDDIQELKRNFHSGVSYN